MPDAFDPDGPGLLQTGDGQFSSGGPIAVDKSNNVYLVDVANNRVEKFLLNGDFVTKWGSKGTNSSQFNLPAGIAVDNAGNVYVADTYNNRIQKFSSTWNISDQMGY